MRPPATAPIAAPATRLPAPRPPNSAPSAPPAKAPVKTPESCRGVGEYGSPAQPESAVAATSAAATITDFDMLLPQNYLCRDLEVAIGAKLCSAASSRHSGSCNKRLSEKLTSRFMPLAGPALPAAHQSVPCRA